MKKFLLLLISMMVWCGSTFAVDLNKATQAELEALKGIGAVKAKAIIDYRTKNGPLKSADDLDKVKGVGKGIIAKIGADVTIDGKPLGMPTAADKSADKKSTKAKKVEEAAPAPAAAVAAAPADEKTVKKEKKKKE
jgi:competence protein ComEA